jgi:hypothetical protein
MERRFTVVNTDGSWVRNPHGYDFVDPSTGYRFAAGEVYKIALTDWITSQVSAGTLAEGEDQEKANSEDAARRATEEAAAAEAHAKAQAEADAAAKAAEAGPDKKAGKK